MPSRNQGGPGSAALVRPSAVGDLFGWWQRQVTALLPAWARLRPAPADAIIINIQTLSQDPHAAIAATGQISTRRSGVEQVVAQLDFSQPGPLGPDASDAIVLRLPARMILHREVTLPIAAERDLASLIHFQMPRLTPFEASEVFWGISEVVRDQTRLKLKLHVVQRKLVERLLGPLARIGLQPSVLEDGVQGIELARFGGRGASPRRARLGVCAILATICLAIPVVSQQLRLDAAHHRLKILLPVQRQITQLHEQIAGLTAIQRLIGQSQGAPDVLRTLALLTNALPDGTWLNDLTVNGNVVAFDGQSSDAADLISALAATPGLKNVEFNAPVTRAPAGGPDLFSIQLTISR